VKPNGGILSLADLKGKLVGIPAVGGLQDIVLRKAAQQYNLSVSVNESAATLSQQICEKLPSITVIERNESNRAHLLTHWDQGVVRTNYRHPLPDHVYDEHMQYWGNIDLII